MLKKILIIISVTIVSAVIAVLDFYIMRLLPRHYALVIHNILASIIGLGFIIASRGIKIRYNKSTYYSLLLLTIGLGMLAIHIIKIFFSRC